MLNIFHLLLAPWRVFAVMTMLSVGVGFGLLALERVVEADKAASLAAGAPALIALKDYAPGRNDRFEDEVNLGVWVDSARTSRLTLRHRGKGTDSDEVRNLYFLFDPGKVGDQGILRAVALVPEDEVDAFESYAAAHPAKLADNPYSFALTGEEDHDSDFDNLISQAVGASGLAKAPDFAVITPWVAGREAKLAPSKDFGPTLVWFFSWLTGGLAGITLAKFLWSLRSPRELPRPGTPRSAVPPREQRPAWAPAPPAPELQAQAPGANGKLDAALRLGATVGFGPFGALFFLPSTIARSWSALGLRRILAPTVYLGLIILSIIAIRNGVELGWTLLGLSLLFAVLSGFGTALKGLFGLFLPARPTPARQVGWSSSPSVVHRPAPAPTMRPTQVTTARYPTEPTRLDPVVAASSPVQRVPPILEWLTGKSGVS
ncbi:hypothetical protein OU426_17515 [Frigidibacter sp. RF13]|uniref:hypothetical protein n=1 Tax=Frigidibacter sp. RF13 TaxID=2997340 RepID=UPI0022714769|nr:hypothetical protein [Frigidibacter sp. RF13]MCY1128659.1 hypothetical protein [Frigidibacter sp. RF13]